MRIWQSYLSGFGICYVRMSDIRMPVDLQLYQPTLWFTQPVRFCVCRNFKSEASILR
jgi:hypothetical protein